MSDRGAVAAADVLHEPADRVRSGGAVARFEDRFAAAAGGDHAVAFAYSRTALGAILEGLGLGRGDRVVLSPLTCKVVPLALLAIGIVPAYADILEETLNLDGGSARRAVARTGARAILFQHTYGWSGGVEEVAQAAQERGLPLIEDCAQSLPDPGARPHTGIAAIYSCNPGKPLPGACGGMAVTDDAALAARIRERRDRLPVRGRIGSAVLRAENVVRNGMPPSLYWRAFALHRRFREREPGSAEAEIRADIAGAAVRIRAGDARAGERWLDRLERVRSHRATCCRAYASALAAARSGPAFTDEPGALYYFPFLSDRKETLLTRARAEQVQLVPWPIRTPIYPVEDEALLPRYGYSPGSCPVAERVARRLIGLPTDIAVGERHRQQVIRLVLETARP